MSRQLMEVIASPSGNSCWTSSRSTRLPLLIQRSLDNLQPGHQNRPSPHLSDALPASVSESYHFLLQELGDALPKVEPLAITALDDTDLEVANDAALALGHWGTASAEAALWARLKRFHQQWQGREDELRATPPYTGPIARATALESTLVNSIATGTNWICGPEKLARLSALASPRQQIQVATWSNGWERGEAIILTNWFPEDRLSFGVLQYSTLGEEQFRAKLSQLPTGMKLYFQIWKPGQISPPVSVEKQEAVFERLRSHAAQFGVTIEDKSDP